LGQPRLPPRLAVGEEAGFGVSEHQQYGVNGAPLSLVLLWLAQLHGEDAGPSLMVGVLLLCNRPGLAMLKLRQKLNGGFDALRGLVMRAMEVLIGHVDELLGEAVGEFAALGIGNAFDGLSSAGMPTLTKLSLTMGPRAVAYARGYEQGWSHHQPAERGVQAYWARQMPRFRLST
jgi:hypothetical protein